MNLHDIPKEIPPIQLSEEYLLRMHGIYNCEAREHPIHNTFLIADDEMVYFWYNGQWFVVEDNYLRRGSERVRNGIPIDASLFYINFGDRTTIPMNIGPGM